MATLLVDHKRNLPVDRIARSYTESVADLAEQHSDVLISIMIRVIFPG